MDGRDFLDFDVLVESQHEGFRTRVLHSPAGEPEGIFELPFSALQVENLVLKLSKTRSGTRSGANSVQHQAARELGSALFESLFSGPVGESYTASVLEAEKRGVGLRLRLRLEHAPGLLDLPWEYLYDRDRGQFLVLSGWTPVVRYPAAPTPSRPLAIVPPLKVLVAISTATPPGAARLDVDREWAKLADDALADAQRRGLIELHRLRDGTLAELNRTLSQGEYHAFHYVGHSSFDPGSGEGVLWLEGTTGEAEPRRGNDVAQLLGSHRSMRLAVFNSCEGARASTEDPFAGVALSVIQKGVPAVIAMQFEITDGAAITFAREFYSAIAAGRTIDTALADARRAIFSTDNDVEWGTPVLFLRSGDGRIFDIAGVSEAELATPSSEGDMSSDDGAGPPPDGLVPAGDEPRGDVVADPRHQSTDLHATSTGGGSRRNLVLGAVAAVVLVLGTIAALAMIGGDGAVPSTSTTSEVAADSTVTTVPSLNVTVPNVTGASDPAGVLTALGFEVQVIDEFSDSVPAGMVIEQTPGPGEQAARGSLVALTISQGPRLVIVFESDRAGNRDIYATDVSGGSTMPLTTDPGNDRRPVWSPDGATIAFVSERDGDQDIYLMNADGSDQRPVTVNDFKDDNPSWSPVGSRIVFRSQRNGDFELFVVEVATGAETQITSSPGEDSRPSWHPTEERIAFDSVRDGHTDPEIYVMNADGTGVQRLTNDPARDTSPAFSPDGRLIAFRSDRTGNGDIYLMAADGTGLVQLTSSSDIDSTPSWSPDGSRIVFESQRNGNFDIFVMNADGTGQRNLTDDPARDIFPSWAPR